MLQLMSRRLHSPQLWNLSKLQQWLVTGVFVVLAGVPFTPLAHAKEELLMHLLPSSPGLACLLQLLHFGLAVVLIRLLLVKVLTVKRFQTPKDPLSTIEQAKNFKSSSNKH